VISESQPSNGDRFKFTARELESALDDYFYRARWYDDDVGRFVSEDPIGILAGDPNFYRYVRNAPTSNTDPSGLTDPDWIPGNPYHQQIRYEQRQRGTESGGDGLWIPYGVPAIGGGSLVVSSLPAYHKPRVGIAGGGPSGPHTSGASKLLRTALPRGYVARSVPRFLARYAVPYVGWGLITYDGARVVVWFANHEPPPPLPADDSIYTPSYDPQWRRYPWSDIGL
jgi:RHS repeat-associated protein